jgi:hypothetical protein
MTNLAEVRQMLITQTSKKFVDTLYKKPWHRQQFGARLQTAKPFRAERGRAIVPNSPRNIRSRESSPASKKPPNLHKVEQIR